MDEAPSECALDGRTWDYVIQNEGLKGASKALEDALDKLEEVARTSLSQTSPEKDAFMAGFILTLFAAGHFGTLLLASCD